MIHPAELKHICIHGHFYQPPRENPWLEAIEREDSAGNYHDWNERIHCECYRANTASRHVDDANHILSLYNNYQAMSFNFGPTLLRWMQQYDARTYGAILQADKESVRRFNGHGNAMAQVYNHLIMPLANRRDKVTQVLWGLRDFEHRFGRRPEGMWLAETAVDDETLGVLAEAGIRFTILSPFQAGQWRFTYQGAAWQDARGGVIPTGRAYRYQCRSGKSIALFFYDAALARGIAFERLLEHSSKLLAQLDASYSRRDPDRYEPWLVHTATDGESYGHHFKFGDMALGAAFQALEQDPRVRLTNYGAFLAAFPPQAEVRILENTAWSCAHGLGRWQSDCGCSIAGKPGWSQKWRGPLREALNGLRDGLAVHFEREMGRLSRDPWQVRDEYIAVLLDPETKLDFAQRHFRSGTKPTAQDLHRFYQLLEMQRYAMFMFTSCGWFFDEVSGLESVLLMKYAARALQLAEQTGASALEPAFLKTLARAPSNLSEEYKNGADVYLKKVKPEVITKELVAANYAIQSMARSSRRQFTLYCYDITPRQEENLGPNPVPCRYGQVTVRDNRTLEAEDYLYTVLHFGGLDFRCSVKPYCDSQEYDSILKTLQQAVEEQDTLGIIRAVDEWFGTDSFSLNHVFRDLRLSIALEISRQTLSTYAEAQRHFYQMYRPLLLSLKQMDIAIPSDLRVALRRILSDEATQIVQELIAHEQHGPPPSQPWDETDFFYRAHKGRLRTLLEEARSWGVILQLTEASDELGKYLLTTLTELTKFFTAPKAGTFFRILDTAHALGLRPALWRLQTLYFDLVQKGLRDPDQADVLRHHRPFFDEVDALLDCRFARFLEPLPMIAEQVVS